MKPRTLALAVLVSSCAAPPPPPPVRPVEEIYVRPPAPPPDPAKLRADAALARVPAIAEQVSQIRALPLKHPVPAEVQSQDDFKKYLDREVKKGFPPEKASRSVRALVRLGLLKQSVDLGKSIEDAMVSQAGAYYDPDTKRFYLVIVPDDRTMLDVMSAHELTHALDDQYFDLAKYEDPSGGDPAKELPYDVGEARHAIAEGEATLVMIAYQAKMQTQQDLFAPENREVARMMVAAFSELDASKVAQMASDNPDLVKQMGPELKQSIEAMASIPPFILDPLFGAYTKGAAAVALVRDAGGWDAVNDLYRNPPESTEQILHPKTKLIGMRDHPVVLGFPALDAKPFAKTLAGFQEIDGDVVGEMTMAVYFKNWGDKTPAAEVIGWGGDRYAAYARGDEPVGCWLTAWDSAGDARRFTRAYMTSLATRFPGQPGWAAKGAKGVKHPDGTVTAVLSPAKTDREVYVLDGARAGDAAALFDWMKSRTLKVQAEH